MTDLRVMCGVLCSYNFLASYFVWGMRPWQLGQAGAGGSAPDMSGVSWWDRAHPDTGHCHYRARARTPGWEGGERRNLDGWWLGLVLTLVPLPHGVTITIVKAPPGQAALEYLKTSSHHRGIYIYSNFWESSACYSLYKTRLLVSLRTRKCRQEVVTAVSACHGVSPGINSRNSDVLMRSTDMPLTRMICHKHFSS